MAHHKRRRPKNRRAGCLICRPWKINGAPPADKYLPVAWAHLYGYVAHECHRTPKHAGSPMNDQRSHRGAASLSLFSALLIVLLFGPSTVVAATAPSPSLTVTGSPLAGVAIQQWVGSTNTLFGLNVNWQITSSPQGLTAYTQGVDDLAASDFTYADDGLAAPSSPYQYVPDVGYAEGFMYNLIGNNGQRISSLILSAKTIGLIFTGAITQWNDPSIVALNPQLAGDLPGQSIIPVYRSDASGDNHLLTDYLIHQDTKKFSAYLRTIGVPPVSEPSVRWPIPTSLPVAGYPNVGRFVPQVGPDNAANYVASLASVGSITYVQTAYAIVHQYPVASIVNESGTAVQPNSVNAATALQKATLNGDLSANLTGVFGSTVANAYPVSSYSYFVAPCSPSLAKAEVPATRCSGHNLQSSTYPAASGAALGTFLNYAVCAGQQRLTFLGYAVLPRRLVAEAFSAIGRIDGASGPTSPTAANCANPYVDGQVVLPK